MTVVDALPPPVRIRRTVLVGIEDLAEAPSAPPPTVPVVPPPTAPAPASAGSVPAGARLTASVLSVVVLLAVVAVTGWLRFAHPRSLPVALPSVTVSATPDLAAGDPVLVEVGPTSGAVRVDLFVDGDWTGSDTTAPYTPEWEHRSPGAHEVKAKVTDADGDVRYSAELVVDVPR